MLQVPTAAGEAREQRWKGQFETRAGWCDTFCPLSFIFLVQWCSKACRVHPPNSVPSVPPIPIPRTQSHTEICSANQRRWRLPWRHTAVLLVLHWMTVTSYDEPSFFNGDRSGCACVCVFGALGGVCAWWAATEYCGVAVGLPKRVGGLTEVWEAGAATKIANERKLFWVRADLVAWDKGWWRWWWRD